VKAAAAAGLGVQMDIAFFAPRWAVARATRGRGERDRQRWEPDAARFGDFATAVAGRYSGRYRDPAAPGTNLPAVRLWTTWNEPNHPGFLLPQWRRTRRGWAPRSPHVYRRLHERGYEAIKRVDARNRVLIGGLASEGGERAGPREGIPPLRFVREMACVDRRGRPLRGGECSDFRPLKADGFAHHPYSLHTAPDVPSTDPDEVAIADMERLDDLLDQLHDGGRIANPLPVHITEYGYETNPPDRARGVSLHDQARYMGLSTFLAWQRPEVFSFAQFLLNDIAPRAGAASPWEDWQSGLQFHDGRPKPAAQAFKLPFWPEARTVADQNVVVLFGQVRPGDGPQRVAIEVLDGGGIWRPTGSLEGRRVDDPCGARNADFATDAEGFYLRLGPYDGPATYRARWIRGNGTSEYGVPVAVGRPRPLGRASG
jgi:hypothetical protein